MEPIFKGCLRRFDRSNETRERSYRRLDVAGLDRAEAEDEAALADIADRIAGNVLDAQSRRLGAGDQSLFVKRPRRRYVNAGMGWKGQKPVAEM